MNVDIRCQPAAGASVCVCVKGGGYSGPPHDGAHVSCQVPAAGSGGQVLLRVQPVGVNHEVPVGQVTEEKQGGARMKAY